MFAGGIDVSVGATMGLTVALMSFVVSSGGLAQGLVVSIALAIGIGLVVGIANATLVERVRISPVIATIAMLGIVSGVGLILRPTAAGTISSSLPRALTKHAWVFPVALLIVAGLVAVPHVGLRSSRTG